MCPFQESLLSVINPRNLVALTVVISLFSILICMSELSILLFINWRKYVLFRFSVIKLSWNHLFAYYAWPRTPSTKVTRKERNPWRQHVHRAATRSIKCERQWRHVALATTGPMLVANNMAAYPLRISNSVCPLRISNTCLMSVHTIYNHVKSIICCLCFMQHAWGC